MLSEVLTSLNEVKSRLQERLLQQPEYPALLIVDKAAFQLGEVLTLLRPQPARFAAHRTGDDAPVAATEAANDPAQAGARLSPREDAIADAPVSMAIAADQRGGAPAETVAAPSAFAAASSLDHSEEGSKDALAEPAALTDRPLEGDVGATGAIPAASGQAPAPRLGSYTPFFIAPRRIQDNRH